MNLGAATIDLQSKPKYKEISDISNMSRYQLIDRLRKLSDISDSDKVPALQSVKGRVLTLLSSIDESNSSQEAANSV